MGRAVCLSFLAAILLAGCATGVPVPVADLPAPAAPALKTAPRLGLALGGGAARGFAHVGVIKVLESHGIVPDIVVGTSAGSVVGALYAAGYGSLDLQRIALQLGEASLWDWSLPDRGVIRGESLQNFINRAVQNRPIEKLNKVFAAVATDLQKGDAVTFGRGNTGMAVRASSSIPGVFQPVTLNGRDYVDGGLVSPIPVRAARQLGAEVVIAVDISSRPENGEIKGSFDVLRQTLAIMARVLGGQELQEADVVIRPNTAELKSTSFDTRHLAILEGERAAQAALPAIREKLAAFVGVQRGEKPREDKLSAAPSGGRR